MEGRPARQKKKNLFERESDIVKLSKTVSLKEDLSLEECKAEFVALIDHFEELVDQSKLITKVSDRLQKKINKANEALEANNEELQHTLDELTQAKVGRKAATITLIVFVVLFLVSEAFVEPVIEDYALDHFSSGTAILGFSLGFKGALALLLRPIEKVVEKILLKQAKTIAKRDADLAEAAVVEISDDERRKNARVTTRRTKEERNID